MWYGIQAHVVAPRTGCPLKVRLTHHRINEFGKTTFLVEIRGQINFVLVFSKERFGSEKINDEDVTNLLEGLWTCVVVGSLGNKMS